MEQNRGEEVQNEIKRLWKEADNWSRRGKAFLACLFVAIFFGIFSVFLFNFLALESGLITSELVMIDLIYFFLLMSLLGGYLFSRWTKEEICVNARRLELIEQERRRLEIELFESEQLAKGLVKFVSISGHVKWGTPNQVREWKVVDLDMRNNFANLTPRQFEKFIAYLFQKMGYQTNLGPYIKDFGADILAKRGEDTVVIQVKKYGQKNKVGAQEVQQVGGALLRYKANRAIIVTTNYFTRAAQKQASGTPIELWNRPVLFDLIERFILSG